MWSANESQPNLFFLTSLISNYRVNDNLCIFLHRTREREFPCRTQQIKKFAPAKRSQRMKNVREEKLSSSYFKTSFIYNIHCYYDQFFEILNKYTQKKIFNFLLLLKPDTRAPTNWNTMYKNRAKIAAKWVEKKKPTTHKHSTEHKRKLNVKQ